MPLVAAFGITDTSPEPSEFLFSATPPIEIVFGEKIGFALDSWYLGLLVCILCNSHHIVVQHHLYQKKAHIRTRTQSNPSTAHHNVSPKYMGELMEQRHLD